MLTPTTDTELPTNSFEPGLINMLPELKLPELIVRSPQTIKVPPFNEIFETVPIVLYYPYVSDVFILDPVDNSLSL